MRIIAIIPARGGSKGIPRKNLRLLAGKPLIAHTIEHAIRARSVNRVIVSTDDPEIAVVSKKCGAEVIKRPGAISGKTATSESALRHALDCLKQKEDYEPDLVVFLQCTSPIREPDDIDKAVKLFKKKKADSLLSGCRSHSFIWRGKKSGFRPVNYDYRNRCRRQDAPEEFVENGAIYICKPGMLRIYNNRLGGRIVLYEMSRRSAFEIDSLPDLSIAEKLLK